MPESSYTSSSRGSGTDYPAPRYPQLKRILSADELIPKVKILVNGQAWEGTPGYMNPAFGIRKDDKVLFVMPDETHPWIIEAMKKAIREVGARVDFYLFDLSPMGDAESNSTHEVVAMTAPENPNDDYNYYYTTITNVIRTSTASFLVEKEKYTKVIAGMAGPLPEVQYSWNHFNYTSLEEFASSQITFPYDLQDLIDDVVFGQIQQCERVRLTDPEGTDIEYSNYNDGRIKFLNHEFGKPLNMGVGGAEDCTGVIAGTINHLGAFPHVKAYVENGRVTKVEGGGKYGETWREQLEKYGNVETPPHRMTTGAGGRTGYGRTKLPGRGYFWYFEQAIGTAPGVFRLPFHGMFHSFTNGLEERKRSGIIHHGFGINPISWPDCARVGLPWIHCHIHNLFPTYVGTADDGSKVVVVDKGHLTALDHPKVRELASRYGNPKELLNETWIPALPGVNVPGDYQKEYAANPIEWIRKETMSHSYWRD